MRAEKEDATMGTRPRKWPPTAGVPGGITAALSRHGVMVTRTAAGTQIGPAVDSAGPDLFSAESGG